MDRYQAQWPRDDASHSDGDSAFIGVNSKLSPEKLTAGMVQEAVNKTFRNGQAATRRGLLTPIHFNPRMKDASFEADYVLVTLTWNAANGDRLNASAAWGRGTDPVFLSPSIPFTGAHPGQIRVGSTVVVEGYDPHADQTLPGRYTVLFRLATLRALFPTQALSLNVQAGLVHTQSVGGNGRIAVAVQPFTGGTMSYTAGEWVNAGGSAGTLYQTVVQTTLDDTDASFNGIYQWVFSLLSSTGTSVVPRQVIDFDPLVYGYTDTMKVAPPPLPHAIWGSSRYADADGREWMLIATETAAWRLADGVAPQSFPFPEPVTAECAFVQFANRVYLFRGEGKVPWRWDGTTAGGWQAISQTDPGNASKPLPGALTAETIGNRLIVPQGRDTVLFTDLSDAEHYDPALNVSINAGTNDNLVRLFPYANGAVLAFKTRSIYLLQNVAGDLSQVTLTNITRAIGCVARRSVVQVGADVWFLSAAGVQRVSQVLQDRIQTDPLPLSDPIQTFFTTRVNWAAASNAVAATLDEYYYLAVPIDGSTRNNAMLVFSTSTSQWEGYWTFPVEALRYPALGPTLTYAAEIQEFVEIDYNGRKRLFAADRLAGYVYLVGEGLVDSIAGATYEIPDRLVTRGYMVGTAELKDFTRAEAVLQTLRPQYSVSLATGDQLGTVPLATDRTRDRTQYYTFGAPVYDPTNANDDHAAPRRQDYAVMTPFQLKSGIAFGLTQTANERYPVRARGRWAALTIASEQGRCDLVAVSIEARQVGRTTRTQP